MLNFVAVLGLFAVASSTPVDVVTIPAFNGELQVPMHDGRIYHGSPVNISEYPWQLSLRWNDSHICGASIISSTWALTAAHCVQGATLDILSLRAGTTNYALYGTIHTLSRGYMHGSFDSSTMDYDIAVLEVSSPFALGTFGISAVALGISELTDGKIVHVSGWGGTLLGGGNSPPPHLRDVYQSTLPRSDCRAAYGDSAITERMICAGYPLADRGVCPGDDGGAMVFSNATQYGIYSWGNDCTTAEYPGVYTSVANLYDWIVSVTGI